MLSPDLEDAISAALLRLTNNLSVFTDEASFELQLDTWQGAAERNRWLTAELVDAAVTVFLDRKPERPEDRKVPPIGDFIAACADAKREAEACRALPPPAIEPVPRDEASFARNVAIGRLRFRNRAALIEQYRELHKAPKHSPVPEEVWRGAIEPTDADVDAFLKSEPA